jgi:hypothetical protein
MPVSERQAMRHPPREADRVLGISGIIFTASEGVKEARQRYTDLCDLKNA